MKAIIRQAYIEKGKVVTKVAFAQDDDKYLCSALIKIAEPIYNKAALDSEIMQTMKKMIVKKEEPMKVEAKVKNDIQSQYEYRVDDKTIQRLNKDK